MTHYVDHVLQQAVPTHIQYAMNIIIFVLLAIVMASVDQSYFGAPNCAKSVSR